MTLDQWQPFLQVGLQIPIVAAFIWFTLQVLRNFRESQKERDTEWQSFLKAEREDFLAQEIRRDVEWRTFLGERSHQNRDVLDGIVKQLGEMSLNLSSLNALLVAHDSSTRELGARIALDLAMLKEKGKE